MTAGGDVEIGEGTVLDGRYRIERLLARGSTGSVYLATQAPFDRPVAIKVLDPKGTGAYGPFVERFRAEAVALSRLQHPNTVRVYDSGTWNGRACLVMEHVDGHSLQRLIAGGPVPVERVLDIVGQICDALQEAHALGLVHRDLKPANLLLTRRAGALDVVKVVDFGLVSDVHAAPERSAMGAVTGTPMFMAPEQIREEACTPRTDLYALGVLLYRMLSGTYPFERGAPQAVLRAHLRDRPPTLAAAHPDLGLPPVLSWIVDRCLEKDPADRFASAVELRKALQVAGLALDGAVAHDVALALHGGRVVLPEGLVDQRGTVKVDPVRRTRAVA